MSPPLEVKGPFPFARVDLEAGRLASGVRHTLADFRRWRDHHPDRIAAHIDGYTRQIESIASRHRSPALAGYWLFPGRRREEERAQIAREVNYFGVYNLAEILAPATVARLAGGVHGRLGRARDILADLDESRGVTGLVESLERQVPQLREIPETAWLSERLDRLHRTLPEAVVSAGGMGKVVRTIAGVLSIGAYDTMDADRAARRAHLTRILTGAYAYGAAYVIVDDTLHDLPRDYPRQADRERCHGVVARALATGLPVDTSQLPDHPLVEELHDLYDLLLVSYPFEEYRHLYQAAEAFYLAQHRDSARTLEEVLSGGLELIYPDIFVKAGMSRVVANLLGRRAVAEGFYARCLNTIFLSQFKDDLKDREEDARAGRLTPFTLPADRLDSNPLYDLFAYDAYVVSEVFRDEPAAVEALTYFGAGKLATHLAADRRHAAELMGRYEVTGEIARFLRAASGLPTRMIRRLDSTDMRLKERSGRVLRHRDQTRIDARTFVSDRLRYINEVARRAYAQESPTALNAIVAYTMDAPGKRLRPALTLMLAEALGVDYTSIEPLLAASELFHTASLIFDDLPAQDGAAVRRGRPAAHTVFDEGSTQLAALSMISTGFGLLAKLGQRYPARRVTDVIAYVGTVLGPDRLCLGQHLDLQLGRDGAPVSGDEITRMYSLKTSTTVEAALVPLMMLLGRPAAEIGELERYAYHAGIAFQIRDDLLDLTASTESLGKDAGGDIGKANAVRVLGPEEARRRMLLHLDAAAACCARLPFDTDLLEGIVRHFVTRQR